MRQTARFRRCTRRGGLFRGSQARVPDDIQSVASVVIKATGLTVSDAIRMFMTRIAADKALPLDLFRLNAETLQAIEQAENGTLTPTTLDGIMAEINAAQHEKQTLQNRHAAHANTA